MEDSPRNGAFSFGPFRLYPTARTLLKGEISVAIGSRAFDILVALVERQGEVLSRRELMSLAWPGLNVEDSNVRVQMAHLRRELRCGDEDERYIVSVAGRGYCFVAIAEWQETSLPLERVVSTAHNEEQITSYSRTPARLAYTVGREENLAELLQTIAERRFVTVVGEGGVGKTTLVLLAADQISDFEVVHFVDLSSADDAATVTDVIAAAIGLETQSQLLSGIMRDLALHRALLILDNCEHVIDEVAAIVGPLIEQTADVHVVATSREAFRMPGEAVYLLRPLGVPPQTVRITAKQALIWPAVQLFMKRAIDGGYQHEIGDEQASTIASICRRLDGNPLAIELAASRIGSYGLERVADLLDNQIALSWRGGRYAHPRHQTVQSMLDWSYAGLSGIDQMTLCRLSVFAGEFSLDAALAVAGGEDADDAVVFGAIGNLVDKSLLVMQPGDGPAKLRLSGITKTYAAIKLNERGEHSLVHQRYIAHELETFCGVSTNPVLHLED